MAKRHMLNKTMGNVWWSRHSIASPAYDVFVEAGGDVFWSSSMSKVWKTVSMIPDEACEVFSKPLNREIEMCLSGSYGALYVRFYDGSGLVFFEPEEAGRVSICSLAANFIRPEEWTDIQKAEELMSETPIFHDFDS
jgi:hypothetical protein